MSARDEYNDQDLLQRLKLGEHVAFEQLYRKYAQRLTIKLISLLRDRELAGDILQDVFVKVWERRELINSSQSLSGYLYTIAANMAKDTFRSAMHRQLYIHAHSGLEEGTDTVSRFVDQKDMQLAIEQALAKLPPRQREVYTLYKIEGLSYKEIQDMLGIGKPAVNRLLQEAGKKMREYLQPISYIFLCSAMIGLT
ncbi:MAG: hypothetical protein BGO31_20745 [Bacteroidetes bacterium 43-16]|uniref:RNA polymerase sigma factor n=1 Tax=uncultured Dysgonomonas sp. TaxID=206096 RepID=UPI00092B9D39|nr:sigma-70 family RNA polymerase sigma factor [uncultured Dysgonomonas sp.]OJV55360.1 MAG: hypothetical protein BGO31_20745 [Bacteroidetes bacterium 43-16]